MAESTGRTSGEADPAGRALPVTDAHLHLWDLGGGGYAWLSGAPERLRHDARWEDTADVHAELGVRRVILVQADDTLADTCALQERAAGIEAEPSPVDRADVVAWLPLDDPDATVEILQDPARSRRVVGARHLVHDDPDPGFLDRPTVRASLSVLAERGLALDVPDAFPRHLGQAARVAEDVEDLTVVLDHLGKPPLGDEPGMDRWEGQLRAFAARPRTVAKLSGLSTSGTGYQDAAELRRAVELALEAFGPHRLLFGSDWPIAPRPFDLGSGTDALLTLLAELPDSERAQILSGTAERIYRRPGEVA